MRGNFEACLAHTLQHEGGWADHPADPGGATMRGVTLATFRAFKGRAASKDELRAISDADLRAIYRRQYWDLIKGDDLPAGLDLVAFDAAVNSGPARGAKWLQRALGVADDGVIGMQTLDAARRANATEAINDALDRRLAFMRAARDARGNPAWPTFGRGWQRRVDAVRTEALRMASVAQPARPIPQLPGRNPLAALLTLIINLFRRN